MYGIGAIGLLVPGEEEDIEGMGRRFRMDEEDMESYNYPSKKLTLVDTENKKLTMKLLLLQQQQQNCEKPRNDDHKNKMKGVKLVWCIQDDIPKYDNFSNRHFVQKSRGESSSFDCAMCDDVISISDQVCLSKCVHRFCKDCIQSYLKKKFQEDARHVECPESKCKVVLTPQVCSDLIPEEVFDAWKSAVEEMNALENMTEIECPYVDCDGKFMDDGKGYMIRGCPKCCKLMCVDCGAAWHHGMDCDTFRTSFYRYGRRQNDFAASDLQFYWLKD